MESFRKSLNIREICGMLLLLACSTVSIAQTREETNVLELSKRKFEWLIHQQADSLLDVLDDRLMYIHSSGWSQSKTEVLEDMQSGRLVYRKVEVREAQVRLYTNTAIVTGKGRFSGAREGNEFDIDLCYTEVNVLKAKKWVLVSRHANRLP
jgi:hypothetical protein